jgi:hypothetical protein
MSNPLTKKLLSKRDELMEEAYEQYKIYVDELPTKLRPDGIIGIDARNNDLDAFRHAYAAGIVFIELRSITDPILGEKLAREFGDLASNVLGQGYEIYNQYDNYKAAQNKKMPENEFSKEKNMDLWNNRVGREIATSCKTKEELAQKLAEALKHGRLITDPKADNRVYDSSEERELPELNYYMDINVRDMSGCPSIRDFVTVRIKGIKYHSLQEEFIESEYKEAYLARVYKRLSEGYASCNDVRLKFKLQPGKEICRSFYRRTDIPDIFSCDNTQIDIEPVMWEEFHIVLGKQRNREQLSEEEQSKKIYYERFYLELMRLKNILVEIYYRDEDLPGQQCYIHYDEL